MAKINVKQSAKEKDVDVRNRQIVQVIGVVLLLIAAWFVYQYFFVPRERFEVTGTVLRAGQPIDMKNCRIVFTNRETKRIGVGELDEQGRYRIRTYKDSGLLPGEYDAMISFPPDYLMPQKSETQLYSSAELEKILSKYIPKKYRDPKANELTLSIVDRDVTFDVDMRE
jgi:hypothetical protein